MAERDVSTSRATCAPPPFVARGGVVVVRSSFCVAKAASMAAAGTRPLQYMMLSDCALATRLEEACDGEVGNATRSASGMLVSVAAPPRLSVPVVPLSAFAVVTRTRLTGWANVSGKVRERASSRLVTIWIVMSIGRLYGRGKTVVSHTAPDTLAAVATARPFSFSL
jgi:hypothetical protein